MKKRIAAAVTLLLFTALLFFLLIKKSPSENALTITGYKLNTYVSFTIYDKDKEYVLETCLDLCDQYELIFSRTNPDSELYRLNHGLLPRSADGYYTVSSDLYNVITIGKKYAALSDNAFSIAMEPLTSLWDFTSGTNQIPASEKINAVLPLLNSNDILLREPNQIAFANETSANTDFAIPRSGIDLGAIAKGYIADRIKEYLLSEGVDSALIYLGGNVLCIGDKKTNDFPAIKNKESAPFTVAIEKPFDPLNEATALLKIRDLSVVTSGNYQRFFEKDGILYHHILNPQTGFPYQNKLTSVTIIASSSTDADALSTACFSLGLKKGLALLESLDYADGFFITEDGNYYYTEGFLEKYEVTFP